MALGEVIRATLAVRGMSHSIVGFGLLDSARAGFRNSPIVSDTRFSAVARWAAGQGGPLIFRDAVFASNTSRTFAGPNPPGVVFRDTALGTGGPRGATPPARTLILVRPRGPIPSVGTGEPKTPFESERFTKVNPPAQDASFSAYPADSHRAMAAAGVQGFETTAFPNAGAPVWGRAIATSAPPSLALV